MSQPRPSKGFEPDPDFALQRTGRIAEREAASTDRAQVIMVVNPNTTVSMTDNIVTAARLVAAPTTVVVGATPTLGVPSVESHSDEVEAAAGVAELIRSGERNGVDGYVIACFGDTGLAVAKELASGPVVGMTEAALFTAALLGHRFAVVTMPERTRIQSDRVVSYLGLGHRCTVRAIDEPVASVHVGSRHLIEAIAGQSRLAMERDGAEVIVLGCAGLADLVNPLQEQLNVPVVDGVASAVTMVEGLLAQGLTTSRRSSYTRPTCDPAAAR